MRAHIVQPDIRDIWMSRAWIPIAGVLVIALIAAIYGMASWLLVDRSHDIAGQPLLTGTATVVSMSARAGTKGNMGDQTPFYEVRFRGGEYWFSSPDAVQVGKPATIEYRVGRSGRIYIQRLYTLKP